VESGEQGSAKYILDFQDALSLNTRRRMERSRGLMRLLLNYEYKALQRAEQQALGLFGATTVIAEADREAIGKQVMLVPNGVDTGYFSPANSGTEKLYEIVFCGNMAYAPNVDAACWLVNEIMPLVRTRSPYGHKVLIAGADPKPAVRALAGPRVTVSGRLDDIRTAYASARMFVAPMRIGSGMQNKLLEAMAMKLPCITTPIAATPLGATAWEHLLVGDTAEQIADLIVKLGTEELHDAIADGGHRFVQQHYSWASAVKPLEELILNSQFSTLNSPNAQLESK
jgi:glycosyltransferase involved in cell wall biosynthesis